MRHAKICNDRVTTRTAIQLSGNANAIENSRDLSDHTMNYRRREEDVRQDRWCCASAHGWISRVCPIFSVTPPEFSPTRDVHVSPHGHVPRHVCVCYRHRPRQVDYRTFYIGGGKAVRLGGSPRADELCKSPGNRSLVISRRTRALLRALVGFLIDFKINRPINER